MLLSNLFCILYFAFMLLFSIFLRVLVVICNYMIFVVLGGFWNSLSFVLYLSLDHLIVSSLTCQVLLPLAANFFGFTKKLYACVIHLIHCLLSFFFFSFYLCNTPVPYWEDEKKPTYSE